MAETICAIATAAGGALGIIRVSGDEAVSISSKIFFPHNGKDFNDIAANHATFGYIENQGQVVDEVVATPYSAPHSYTGENAVEFSCHGSQYILSRIIELLITHGCRLAKPGEYTERAFLNGKMDLSQAEAVADVIAANSERYNRIAINQLRGGFRKLIDQMHDKILDLRSMLELELDFSDHEDLEFAQRPQLLQMANEIKEQMDSLTSSFASGNTIKNGIPVAIIGSPNVGKSTLMNAILKDDRAIVSDIPGTTRDTIEEKIYIDGLEFRLIDTAGIRTTDDKIENLGINRTIDAMKKAQTVICIVNVEKPEVDTEAFKSLADSTSVIIAINKTDLAENTDILHNLGEDIAAKISAITENKPEIVYISAKNGTGIELLKKKLVEVQGISASFSSDTVIVNKRHYEALSQASINMAKVIDGITSRQSAEIVSLDLRQVDFNLTEINGATTPQSVLNNIFSKFCIGK